MIAQSDVELTWVVESSRDKTMLRPGNTKVVTADKIKCEYITVEGAALEMVSFLFVSCIFIF